MYTSMILLPNQNNKYISKGGKKEKKNLRNESLSKQWQCGWRGGVG